MAEKVERKLERVHYIFAVDIDENENNLDNAVDRLIEALHKASKNGEIIGYKLNHYENEIIGETQVY